MVWGAEEEQPCANNRLTRKTVARLWRRLGDDLQPTLSVPEKVGETRSTLMRRPGQLLVKRTPENQSTSGSATNTVHAVRVA